MIETPFEKRGLHKIGNGNIILDFLKNTLTCSQDSTLYQTNLNNNVEGFFLAENHQKCPKLSLLDPLLKIPKSVDRYLKFVHIFKLSEFYPFFSFF